MFRALVRPTMKLTRTATLKAVQPRAYIPMRAFSTESSWKDIFTGKKEKETTQEAPKTEEVNTEAKVEEPVQETPVQETPVEETPVDANADPKVTAELLEGAKAKLAEYSKEIDGLKLTTNRLELATKEYQSKVKELQQLVLNEREERDRLVERNRKDVADVKKFGIGSFCKNLLEGVDTLEMCLAAGKKSLEANPTDDLERFIEGIHMTNQMFAKILASQGVTKFESLGLKADPNLHDVTAQLPHPEAEEGTITFVIKEGYMIHDRVLRPAQVCIAAPKQ